MKVLLTGASGFVGSHILDRLRASEIPVVLLLRPTSEKRFLEEHLRSVEVRTGSILEPESLRPALQGITHIIHCAGCTKAHKYSQYFEINHLGTRHLIEAANDHTGQLQRFLHVSSLAVAGPATPAQPAREDDQPRPISHYGKSKLAAEMEVLARCRAPFTILRPSAVYGPRDTGFLPIFKAVKRHLLPKPGSHQALSLVYATDVADAVVACLQHPGAEGKTYFVAHQEPVTAQRIAQEIASQAQTWTVPCPSPMALLWVLCLTLEIASRLSGKATLLNLQKFAELRAPGWVCDTSRLAQLGCRCKTTLPEGIPKTLAWYRQNRWL